MEEGLRRVSVVSQLFIKRNTDSTIKYAVAKVTDDIPMDGKMHQMESLMEALTKRFRTEKVIIGDEIQCSRT